MKTYDAEKTLAETAFRRLRSDILAGRLNADRKLRLVELGETYAIGLGPLREALSRLASTGLVIAEGQRGFRVAPVSASNLLDLMKTRILIEAIALRLSVALGNLDWESEVLATHHRLVGAGRNAKQPIYLDETWQMRHREYHMTLLAGAGHGYLTEDCAMMFDLTDRYRHIYAVAAQEERDVEVEHEAITQVILARDAERAINLTELHNLKTARALLLADPRTAGDAKQLIENVRQQVSIGLARKMTKASDDLISADHGGDSVLAAVKQKRVERKRVRQAKA
jgi:GntR family transcriptional regulator, carbon starvation induced regulator